MELKQWIVRQQIGCIGLQETNINWTKCNDKERFAERMKYPGFEFVRTTAARNKHGDNKKYNHGGTGIVCVNQLTHRIVASGADERGLERWSWMAFRRSNGTSVRIISAYQPCKVNDPLQNHTVYRQQIQYCNENDVVQCTLELYKKELCALISKWIKKGDKIILVIDVNEDVIDGPLNRMLYSIGLHSAPRSKFGQRPPPTQHNGSKAIDDIYVSSDVRCNKTGYFAFGDGPGDHRGLFIDLHETQLFGDAIHAIHRLPARRLITSNHKVVEKFNKLYEGQILRNHIPQQLEYLHQITTYPASPDQITLYNKLDNLQWQAFRYADKKCRKLRVGDVAFEPETVQIEGKRIAL